MRAKMRLTKVTHYPDGGELEFHPVVDGSEENKQFYKYTPTGVIQMSVVNPAIMETVKAGDEYYVDFTKVKALA